MDYLNSSWSGIEEIAIFPEKRYDHVSQQFYE